jgi:hypothetical protein
LRTYRVKKPSILLSSRLLPRKLHPKEEEEQATYLGAEVP